jgi:hypothetical protein
LIIACHILKRILSIWTFGNQLLNCLIFAYIWDCISYRRIKSDVNGEIIIFCLIILWHTFLLWYKWIISLSLQLFWLIASWEFTTFNIFKSKTLLADKMIACEQIGIVINIKRFTADKAIKEKIRKMEQLHFFDPIFGKFLSFKVLHF